MKKLFLLVLLFSLMLLSCEKSVLDESAFDENVRKEHPTIFYEKDHEHDIRYEYLPDYGYDWDQINGRSTYHRVYCTNENCDYEAYTEAHVIKKSSYMLLNTEEIEAGVSGVWIEGFHADPNPHRKENGCYYHRVPMYCAHCSGGQGRRVDIELYVRCVNQEPSCKGEHYTNMSFEEWRAFLCEHTPYTLEPD